MLTVAAFNTLLAERKVLIIDGALATELESRGHDLNHPLWSAKLLTHQPEAIRDVHLDYYLSGADIAITASYQASLTGFRDHFGIEAEKSLDLIKKSVELAHEARLAADAQRQDRDDRQLLIAGSVGPYGAFLSDGSEYRGDYRLSKEELQRFHRPRIQALIAAGADLLAIETFPQLLEIEAVLEMLRHEFEGTIAWISCTLVDSGHISDGTCIEQVLRVVNQYQDVVVAFGINCVAISLVGDALRLMKRRTRLPLLCYPNSGEVWDAETKTWSGQAAEEQDLAEDLLAWQVAGAKLIGGCCRTGPQDVRRIATTLA